MILRKFVFGLFLVASLLFVACTGQVEEVTELQDGDDVATVDDVADNQENEADELQGLNPEDIGNRIGELYVDGLKEVISTVKSTEDEEVLKNKLELLKNSYITKYVSLGKLRQKLPIASLGVVDATASLKLNQVPMELFNDFQDATFAHKENLDLYNLIASFNVITQYADFELLSKQLPEEAKRLGVFVE